ncbi:MAG: hydrogenase iron-sulfur subunit [Methermicoccaceae archaeon]
MSERSKYLTEQQVRTRLKELKREMSPLVVVFVCSWCCNKAEQLLAQRLPNASVEVLRIKCTGVMSNEMVLEALQRGADGVFIAGCKLGECRYKSGNYQCLRRMDALKKELKKRKIPVSRVASACLPPSDDEGFIDLVDALVKRLPRA